METAHTHSRAPKAAEPDVVTGAVAAELVDAAKVFGSTTVLDGVSLSLRRGEVLGLLGENGAGKSTCVKILAGVYRPDRGVVRVGDRDLTFHSPADARRHGIAVVHQHPGLFGDLSIAENIYAGRLPLTRAGAVDFALMRREAARWLSMLGLERDPSLPVSSLSTSEQQMVEIARALAGDADVLILDEPTAALSAGEVATLENVIRRLRERGVAMMFVGHRMEEIFRICDRLAILRDGRLLQTVRSADITQRDAVALMVGRELTDLYPERDVMLGEPVLHVTGLSRQGDFDGIDLSVRAGEIVGLAGLVGSGRTELARVLFGVHRQDAGVIHLDGEPVALRSVADALSRGIAYVSEDRRGQSVIEDFSVLENATLPVIDKASRFGLVLRHAQLALVSGPLARMKLRSAGFDQPVGALSGGNQQKIVLAKWLAVQPRLLILDEPTQGIDIGAKAEVHRIINSLAEKGMAIILISSDLPELLGMSDRVLVMRHGSVVAEFDRERATPYAVGLAATGVGEKGAPEPGESTVDPAQQRKRSVLARIRSRRETGLLMALLALTLPLSLLNPQFLSLGNLTDLAVSASLLGTVALGQLLVMLTRNIDLSVSSVIGLTAFASALLIKEHPGLPIVVPVLLACAVGLACGAFNGLIVSYGQVPSIVATLGTLALFRGIDAMMSAGKQVAAGEVPAAWLEWTAAKPLGVPMLIWVSLVLFVAAGFALGRTRRGRELYASGSNPAGARQIGIPVDRHVLGAFAVSGLLAGLVGALWASHYGTVDGQAAYGLELTVIASVVVGGVALRGGYGSVQQVALGTFALLVIENILTLVRVDSRYLQAVFGAVILVAVSLDAVLARRRSHRRAA
ncbi:ATP-binding cassette domain-containing protein [Streptomyces sp. TRM49041]|uniref:ATP-binding cassette domain-containing protein n=1 Tax=Streptomyces sp. TRM49041 TaxID=2603216 RepID=UPI0011ECB105|nr:ATP-binding cassette domain-containing protein [Streptomyces sp. TRM49041]